MDFTPFDTRRYPVLSVRDGYSEWSASYEDTVLDIMDLRLLARLKTVPWRETSRAVDLACGTGRIGAWLKAAGAPVLDGIDLTEAMLAKAKARGIYTDLRLGDLAATGFAPGAYDLATEVLACEHLADLGPLYLEAARLVRTGGHFVTVGYHPFFMVMMGIPTHFDRPGGQSMSVQTHVHLFSDHFKAATRAGFVLREVEEGLIDDAWVASKPKWEAHRHKPVSFALVWENTP